MNASKFVSRRCIIIATLGVASLLQACAGLGSGYETPTVTVNSFRTLPSEGMLPNFEIGLHVINPNRDALSVLGVSYTVSLDGHELIKGVGNELPVIDAYGEGDFILTASPNLFAGIRFVTELLSASKERVNYELEAKLDLGGFRPTIRVSDSGTISLRPGAGR